MGVRRGQAVDKQRIGLIGGGLMGKEAASALGRWFALADLPVMAELVAVCDTSEPAREWFRRISTVRQVCADYEELLANDEVDAVYAAVPHHLHEQIYSSVLESGKDLFAEKPFGMGLPAAERILAKAKETGRFVRCSSEFPFFPGAQRAFEYVRDGACGRLLEMRCAFLHSSDMDLGKPINWKRQAEACGEIGVMGDLGLHVAHVPLRLGIEARSVYAQLQNVVPERPDGKGGTAPCDTFDNATLHLEAAWQGREFPLRLEMKRLAPGETNTWTFEALGLDGGVRFSTKEAKSLWLFDMAKEQGWRRVDLGHGSVLPTLTGAIFEFGFPDALLQMWGAFALERAGRLGARFGCATPEEAVESHRWFDAALRSHCGRRVVEMEP
jgi:predicted dehydrogenase